MICKGLIVKVNCKRGVVIKGWIVEGVVCLKSGDDVTSGGVGCRVMSLVGV